GQGSHRARVVAVGLSRPRHPRHRALLQLARRGDPRRSRSATASERGAIWRPRTLGYTSSLFVGRSGGTGRRARLRGVWGNPWGFESPLRHQFRWGASSAPPTPQRSERPGEAVTLLYLA